MPLVVIRGERLIFRQSVQTRQTLSSSRRGSFQGTATKPPYRRTLQNRTSVSITHGACSPLKRLTVSLNNDPSLKSCLPFLNSERGCFKVYFLLPNVGEQRISEECKPFRLKTAIWSSAKPASRASLTAARVSFNSDAGPL